MSTITDLTGQRFGRLTVIKPTDKRSDRKVVWECLCDCGNKCFASSANLKKNNTQSCGCLKKTNSIRTIRKVNTKNLREGTHLGALTAKKPKNNTSGYKGVSRDNQSQKWQATIMLKGKAYYLGRFDKIQDAVKTRLRAEEKYFKPILEKYGR